MSLKTKKWKLLIPADVDPIKLADKLKAGLTTEWLKRKAKLRGNTKSLLAR